MPSRLELPTPRLVLTGADESLLRAELHSREALAVAIGAAVPASWPPEHHDSGVIGWVLNALETLGPDDPWRFFYVVLNEPRTLIGTCGFKQPPDVTGCVELGYSMLLPYRCRGFASESVRALISLSFANGAIEVAAETFPTLVPSLRVMQKCGMTYIGEGSEPGTVRYSRRR